MSEGFRHPSSATDVTSIGRRRLSQQILNLLHAARRHAAEADSLRALDRRELEDCGMTPADVAPGMVDLYAQDYRVAAIAWRSAA